MLFDYFSHKYKLVDNPLAGPFTIFYNNCKFKSKASYTDEKVVYAYFLWCNLSDDRKKFYEKIYLKQFDKIKDPGIQDYYLEKIEQTDKKEGKIKFSKLSMIKSKNVLTSEIKSSIPSSEKKLISPIGFDYLGSLRWKKGGYYTTKLVFLTFLREILKTHYTKDDYFNKLKNKEKLTSEECYKLAIHIGQIWNNLNSVQKKEWVKKSKEYYRQ